MCGYERKLAVKRINADARKAINNWKDLRTVGIDTILHSMGYVSTGIYSYEKRYWAGMKAFTLVLDSYELLVGRSETLNKEVLE